MRSTPDVLQLTTLRPPGSSTHGLRDSDHSPRQWRAHRDSSLAGPRWPTRRRDDRTAALATGCRRVHDGMERDGARWRGRAPASPCRCGNSPGGISLSPILAVRADKAPKIGRHSQAELNGILDRGGSVLTHCYGGHGRSGMVTLRLMVERGEEPETALARIRTERPGCGGKPRAVSLGCGGAQVAQRQATGSLSLGVLRGYSPSSSLGVRRLQRGKLGEDLARIKLILVGP